MRLSLRRNTSSQEKRKPRRREPERAAQLQQFVYRQLMYVVIIESTVSALAGARAHWRHLTRTGDVQVKTA